jgi:hypothetical protein
MHQQGEWAARGHRDWDAITGDAQAGQLMHQHRLLYGEAA